MVTPRIVDPPYRQYLSCLVYRQYLHIIQHFNKFGRSYLPSISPFAFLPLLPLSCLSLSCLLPPLLAFCLFLLFLIPLLPSLHSYRCLPTFQDKSTLPTLPNPFLFCFFLFVFKSLLFFLITSCSPPSKIHVPDLT